MTDETPDPLLRLPSSRFVFDKTIQVGTLLSMLLLAVSGVGGAFVIYQGVDHQLYDQKMATLAATNKIENLSVELRVIKESVSLLKQEQDRGFAQTKSDQKETDNALRKKLDEVADALLKVQLSLASRGGRTLRLQCSSPNSCSVSASLLSISASEDTSTQRPADTVVAPH